MHTRRNTGQHSFLPLFALLSSDARLFNFSGRVLDIAQKTTSGCSWSFCVQNEEASGRRSEAVRDFMTIPFGSWRALPKISPFSQNIVPALFRDKQGSVLERKITDWLRKWAQIFTYAGKQRLTSFSAIHTVQLFRHPSWTAEPWTFVGSHGNILLHRNKRRTQNVT